VYDIYIYNGTGIETDEVLLIIFMVMLFTAFNLVVSLIVILCAQRWTYHILSGAIPSEKIFLDISKLNIKAMVNFRFYTLSKIGSHRNLLVGLNVRMYRRKIGVIFTKIITIITTYLLNE
jgi:hypothetical protein